MEPFYSHLKFQEPSSNELKNFNKGFVDFSVTGQKLNISSFGENALSYYQLCFCFIGNDTQRAHPTNLQVCMQVSGQLYSNSCLQN